MDEDFAFLRAVLNQPQDDTLRLVYADWLQEHGDPRAQYLRLEVQWYRSGKRSGKRSATLEKRMKKLAPKLNPRWVNRIVHTRNLAPGVRVDLVTVSEGKGLIEVRGQSETVLLVEGRPIALNWDDCQGSVGQYLVFTGHARGADYARQLTEFVAGPPDANRLLADQIEPLLTLFASGTYSISYVPSESAAMFECPDPASAPQNLVNYYPTDRNLICTQPNTSIDAARVGYFRERIRGGSRPTVLTTSAESAWCEFVIDGHHKLSA